MMDKTYLEMIRTCNLVDWKIATDYLIDKGYNEEIVQEHKQKIQLLEDFTPVKKFIQSDFNLERGTLVNKSDFSLLNRRIYLSVLLRKVHNQSIRRCKYFLIFLIKRYKFNVTFSNMELESFKCISIFNKTSSESIIDFDNYYFLLTKIQKRINNFDFCTENYETNLSTLPKGEEIRRLDERIPFLPLKSFLIRKFNHLL